MTNFTSENRLYSMTDESLEIQEGFKIDNDGAADWAIEKIKEERQETERLVSICKLRATEYEEKARLAEQQCENKTSYLISLLQSYFNTVKRKETKTQETYKLATGTLKLKHNEPQYVRDEAVLVKWLKENNYSEFVKVEETGKWGELKNKIKVDGKIKTNGETVVTGDGEIILGVKAVARPSEFTVEV